MSRRTLVALIGLLVVLVVVAGITLMAGRPASPEKALLFPGLEARVNDINRIEVTAPAGDAGGTAAGNEAAGSTVIATVERAADRWTVKERHGYPADVGRLRRNLLALANARIIEQKTSDPAFYDRLGVQDPAKAGSKGTELRAEGAGQPVNIIIGLPGPGGGESTYVRRPGEAASWLVTGRFDPGAKTGDWLDPALLNIPASRIESVSITHPDGSTLRIIRKPKTAGAGAAADPTEVDFDVPDMPKGRSMKYPGMANGIAGALADLSLEDVFQRDSLGSAPGKPVVARFVTTDGLVVEASAWRLPEHTLFSFSASPLKPAGSTAATGKDGKPAAPDKAATEAAAINGRLAGWFYSLPSYKAEQFTRTMTELLAPK